MAGTSFKTNPIPLYELLKECHDGKIQLPDFQRSWVWDEDRIKSLIASISRAFPVGALMTLDTGGPTNFKPRPVEGSPDSAKTKNPQSLLLDGQQRITSLYQATIRGQVVHTQTIKKKNIKRWFYIDIRKSVDPTVDRDDAIISVPEDRLIRSNFGRKIDADYNSNENEFKYLVFPLARIFDWNAWQMEFVSWATKNGKFVEFWPVIQRFHDEVISHFAGYQVPVIALDKSTSKEAVCIVFEKVNTGGKALDAFELVTAMYAAEGHELRKDWFGDNLGSKGRKGRFHDELRMSGSERGILDNVANTDFLQVVSLFHTRSLRKNAEQEGKEGNELTQITGKREALLNLPLSAYKKFEQQAEDGFIRAAKFLRLLRVYRINDLPYQTQIVPLAAILAENEGALEHDASRSKIERWYWCGVFGELYGSAVDTRIAKDFDEVTKWLRGGPEPTTVFEASFRRERLRTMRMRLSAAYKGVNILMMKRKALDFRSGQEFSDTMFFDEAVDIHHIFPKAWCIERKLDPKTFDSIINKTPLSFRTNRIIGGVAPSAYLENIEKGDSKTPPVSLDRLNEILTSHLIDPKSLRSDDFNAFMDKRQSALLSLIEDAMGKRLLESIESQVEDDGEGEGEGEGEGDEN